MKTYRKSIKDFIEYLKESDNSTENDYYILIINYLNPRLQNRIACECEELEDLVSFGKQIKDSTFFKEKHKKKILGMIHMLYLLSKDASKFDYIQKSEQEVSELTREELLEYGETLIKNHSVCSSLSKIKKFIIKYLERFEDTSSIFSLIEKYRSVFTDNELKKLIYNNSLLEISLLKNILRELKQKNISSKKLEEYFEQLNKISDGTFSKQCKGILDIIFGIVSDKERMQRRIDDIDYIPTIEEKTIEAYENISCESEKFSEIRNKIISGEIELSNSFPNINIYTINFSSDTIDISNSNKIIAIDEANSPDLDGAFSIKLVDGTYIFDVYITDVPTFLKNNKELCREAYLRGCSMYIRDYKNMMNINIDMLPVFLSHKFLSLNKEDFKNVIDFNFVIGKNGKLYSSDIKRGKIMVTNRIAPVTAEKILSSEEYMGQVQKSLRHYQNLCKIICKSSKDEFLKHLNPHKISDLIAFPSIFTNYYIGHEAEYAIYRNDGVYTNEKSSYYTHSTTPLRKFVSDINLAFFLEQKGVVSFPDRDLNYVESHTEEIIGHLNERDTISKFIESNNRFVKKYVLDKK